VPPSRRPASPRPPPTSAHVRPRAGPARRPRADSQSHGRRQKRCALIPRPGEPPQPVSPGPPFPGPEVAPLPGKSSPQEKARSRALTQKTGDPHRASNAPPRGCPRCHKAGTAGITNSPGKTASAARRPRTTAVRQPPSSRPPAAQIPDSGRFAITGTVHPSQRQKPPLTWGGWLAGLRSMSTDPTPSKSKRVGSANTPLQPTSHPKPKTKVKVKDKNKSQNQGQTKSQNQSQNQKSKSRSKPKANQVMITMPAKRAGQIRPWHRHGKKHRLNQAQAKTAASSQCQAPTARKPSKAPSTAPAPLRHQIRETQPGKPGVLMIPVRPSAPLAPTRMGLHAWTDGRSPSVTLCDCLVVHGLCMCTPLAPTRAGPHSRCAYAHAQRRDNRA
jgi:hypothetical protein